jgi:PD-(D/E)XK nuclease superfamily
MKLEIHASALDDFADCPLRGAAKLLKHEFKQLSLEMHTVPLWVSATVGSSIHKGAAELHFGKDLETSIAAAKAEFQRLKVIDNPTFTSTFPNEIIINAHIEEYVIFYDKTVKPLRNAKLNEKNFKYEIRSDITMNSTIDRYTEDEILADLKTGDKVTSAWNQLGMYLFLLKSNGESPQGALLDYLRRPKDGLPVGHEPVIYKVESCLETSKRTVARLIKDYDHFSKTNETRIFTTNPRSTYCNSKFCSLYGTTTCPSWR